MKEWKYNTAFHLECGFGAFAPVESLMTVN